MSATASRALCQDQFSADALIPARALINSCSLEVSAKDIPALTEASPRISPGTTISIPYLPNQNDDARLSAARAVRELGFEPMPHLSARYIGSLGELDSFVGRAVAEAGVKRCFVIAGDSSTPAGPFPDSISLIETGILERAGIQVVGVGGHPESHPVMSKELRWDVLNHKCRSIQNRGMASLIVTQFAFDAEIVLAWLSALRDYGIEHPVHVGVPGPAGVAVLLRYAAMCGVGACASMLSKYGVSIGKLLGTTGPDAFVDRLAAGLSEAHGEVGLHFFPFGGIAQSVTWIAHYSARVGAPPFSERIA